MKSLVRYEPSRPLLGSAFSVLDRFFEDSFIPRLRDIHCFEEIDGEYVLDIDIPGFNKEEIKVNIDNGFLTLDAVSKTKGRMTKDTYSLPNDALVDTVSSSLENGVLTVKFERKTPPPSNKKEVKIN